MKKNHHIKDILLCNLKKETMQYAICISTYVYPHFVKKYDYIDLSHIATNFITLFLSLKAIPITPLREGLDQANTSSGPQWAV